MFENIDRPVRAKLVGVEASCQLATEAEFRELRTLLEQSNTHFNGAAEMLERLEAALFLSTGFRLPRPNDLAQNANQTLGLVWDDLSIIVSNEVIMWRYSRAGEPHYVTDAATVGIPSELLQALAAICRMRGTVARVA